MSQRAPEAIQVLGRTPAVLSAWLRDLPDGWAHANQGDGSWSPFDVVGHLLHCEHEDWMPRLRVVLEHGEARPFEPFDREKGVRAAAGRALPELLDELADLRAANVRALGELALTDEDLARRGTHPAFGRVTLGELIATWTVHDLSHLGQIARTMARRWRAEVGPWSAYLPALGSTSTEKSRRR